MASIFLQIFKTVLEDSTISSILNDLQQRLMLNLLQENSMVNAVSQAKLCQGRFGFKLVKLINTVKLLNWALKQIEEPSNYKPLL